MSDLSATRGSSSNGFDRVSAQLRSNSTKPCPLLKRGDGTSNLIEFVDWIEPIMVQQFGNLALVIRSIKEYVPNVGKYAFPVAGSANRIAVSRSAIR